MPPKPVTDKFRSMLYDEHIQIPGFASAFGEFEEMWDDATYIDSDKLSI